MALERTKRAQWLPAAPACHARHQGDSLDRQP